MTTQIFSLPVWPCNQPPSYRAQLCKLPKKRKHEDTDESREGVESHSQSASSGISSPNHAPTSQGDNAEQPASSLGQISLDDAHQYRYAGLAALDNLPGGSFPHRPLQTDVEISRQKTVRLELASLNPSLFAPDAHLKSLQGSVRPLGMRYQHLAVITTILHRSILEGDFERAERAWAMILRTGMRGRGVDMRGDGRWGIGAEILLQKGESSKSHDRTSPGDEDEPRSGTPASEKHPTEAALEEVKEYYERMILQFPYNKVRPHVTDSLDFYPAMFGVWIYSVQNKYKRKRSQLQSIATADSNSDSDPESTSDSGSSTGYDGHSAFKLYRASSRAKRKQHKEPPEEHIRTAELAEAEAIAARMDDVLASPPYGDSLRLWNLRGMLSLYLGDICLSPEPPAYNEEGSSDAQHRDADERVNVLLARSNHSKSVARREKELSKARAAFARVSQLGGRVWAGVKEMLEKEEGPEMETDDG
ncbi:MAG: hypothetical protein M1829_000958 [Trizodia sp. TS-e1964]|nr:MAG: hypothetical protein M1829_000958 [Trizodia sp. TS-e1964]